MTMRQLLQEEIARRGRLRAAVLELFEVTTNRRDRVRRAEVAEMVCRRMGVMVVNDWWHRQVRSIVEGLGAEPVQPNNKRMYRKMRRR